jgi:hypothetical protein
MYLGGTRRPLTGRFCTWEVRERSDRSIRTWGTFRRRPAPGRLSRLALRASPFAPRAPRRAGPS